MKQQLTRGVSWLVATRLLVNLLSFVSTLILARMLVPADFGLVAIATTVAILLTSITDISLTSALVQHPDPQDSHYDAAWTLNVVRASILALIVAGAAHPVALLYQDPRLTGLFYSMAGTSFLAGLNNPKFITFSRELLFRQEFIFSVSQKLLTFIVAVAVAFVYRSYWALVLGGVAAQILGLILSYAMRPYRPRLRMEGSRGLLSFSVWLSLGQAMNTLNWKLDAPLAGYFLGSVQVGYYTFGDNLAQLPTREATSPIGQALFPAFSRMTDEPHRLRAAYQRAQTLLVALALPLGFGFAMVARPFVHLALGDKWLPAIFVIQLLAGIFAAQTLASTLQPLGMAMGKTRVLFQRDAINFAVRIPLVVGGMLVAGLSGMVIARVVSGLVSIILNMTLVKRLLGLSIRSQLAPNVRAFVAVACMMGVLGLLLSIDVGSVDGIFGAVRLGLLVTVGGLVYLGVMTLLWIAAKRPPGVESELAEMIRPLLSRWGRDREAIAADVAK